MMHALKRLKNELGLLGLGSLGLLALSAAFSLLVVKPLEARLRTLEHERHGAQQSEGSDGLKLVGASLQAARVADFYRYFDRQQRVDDWLARLHGIATASGLELRTGNYRLAEAQRRIDRYEISLPVSGSYTQIRAFLEGALAEIPVLSLDQASFRRKGTNETRIEAEIVLTLHLLHK